MLIAKGIERERKRETSMQTNGFKHMLSCLYSWWGWREEYQRGRKEKVGVEVKTALAAWFIHRVTFNLEKKTMHIKMQNRLLQWQMVDVN